MKLGSFIGLLSLAFRNVVRQRTRTIATLTAICVGVAGLIVVGGFVQDIFVQLGEAIIGSQTGHIQITREGYREGRTRKPEAYYIDNPEAVKAKVAADPRIEKVVARMTFSGSLNNGKRDLGIIGEGIEPKGEGALGTYLRYTEGRPLAGEDFDRMVVGQGVARSLNLKIGDRVTMVVSLAQGAVNTLDFEVAGVFQSFSKDFDARAIRIPIAAARELLDSPTAHILVVMLKKTEDTDRVLAAVRERLSGQGYDAQGWKSLSDFYEKAVDLYDRQFGVLRLIILLMVILSVANSVNMTLFERTREFGTMLALGNRPSVVFLQIQLEGAIVGATGAIVGMLLGYALAAVISAIGIPMPPPPNTNLGYTAVIRVLPDQVIVAGLTGLFATCVATILPGRRAARSNVVEALRHGA